MKTELRGRFADNWKPLFAVAHLVGDEAVANLQKYIDGYKEVDIDTNDATEEFLNILFEVVNENEEFYSCKQIADWQGMKDLLGFTKSPAHWIGRKLTEYKFLKKRLAGGHYYTLSKKIVHSKLELYFGAEPYIPLTEEVVK